MKEKPLFVTSVWITFLVGVSVYIAGASVWAYSTFQTKVEAQSIENRLIRIEDKLDKVIEREIK